MRPVQATWRHVIESIARLRVRRRQRLELASLDSRALRDLGLSRSELASYAMERAGAADATRRRLATT
jgi:uncharacterized protein YjiS (DUF1127 family)